MFWTIEFPGQGRHSCKLLSDCENRYLVRRTNGLVFMLVNVMGLGGI